MEDTAEHWDSIFQTRRTEDVSWFEAVPTTSLRLLERWTSRSGSAIDVGAGRSTLVDVLLTAGWADVTALDISNAALTEVRDRLGPQAESVHFITADIRTWQPKRTYDAWHDRAVFHFLVEPVDRDRYVATAARSVSSGGVLVLATFAADGPTECSGLPAARYDSDELANAFGVVFALEHAEREEHTTPFGTVQPFSWVVLRQR